MSCITELLELKGDKPFFVPQGHTVAVEGGGTYKGHEYLITLNHNGHRCGYVALLPDHPFNNAETYNDLDIECHGGLTFMSHQHDLKESLTIACNDTWIGFDCGHYYDLPDVEAYKQYFGDYEYNLRKDFFDCFRGNYATLKKFDYVEQQCKSIIDQLIEQDNP